VRDALWRDGAAATAADFSSEEVARLTIECGLLESYRRVFATLFWFTVLPGPAGAVLYRATALLAQEWQGDARGADITPIAKARQTFGTACAAVALAARLDSGSPYRAVVRHRRRFRGRGLLLAHASRRLGRTARWRACRHHPGEWRGSLSACASAVPIPVLGGEPDFRPELGLGEAADPDLLPSAVGLGWRALILWLLLMLLLTLANWAP
jgi:adenosylcobinamide-phosphate synthase